MIAADADADAGIAIEPQPYAAVLEAVLLTEREAIIMRCASDAGERGGGVVSRAGRWRAPTKGIGRELAAHLVEARRPRGDAGPGRQTA